MSADQLALIAGAVLSLAFSYIPGLSNWYGKLDAIAKRLVMLGLLVVTAGAVFGIACWGIVETGVTCDQAGALGMVRALIAAMIANKATFLISPRRFQLWKE